MRSPLVRTVRDRGLFCIEADVLKCSIVFKRPLHMIWSHYGCKLGNETPYNPEHFTSELSDILFTRVTVGSPWHCQNWNLPVALNTLKSLQTTRRCGRMISETITGYDSKFRPPVVWTLVNDPPPISSHLGLNILGDHLREVQLYLFLDLFVCFLLLTPAK